jgi:hypothetical protein
MEPMLKAPGTERLKLYHDEPPSTFTFKFNLRLNIEGWKARAWSERGARAMRNHKQRHAARMVEWCRLTASKFVLKAPMVPALETTIS